MLDSSITSRNRQTDTPPFFNFSPPIYIFKQKKVKENEFHNSDSFFRRYYLFLFLRKEEMMLIHLALFIRTPSSLYAACYYAVRWIVQSAQEAGDSFP